MAPVTFLGGEGNRFQAQFDVADGLMIWAGDKWCISVISQRSATKRTPFIQRQTGLYDHKAAVRSFKPQRGLKHKFCADAEGHFYTGNNKMDSFSARDLFVLSNNESQGSLGCCLKGKGRKNAWLALYSRPKVNMPSVSQKEAVLCKLFSYLESSPLLTSGIKLPIIVGL